MSIIVNEITTLWSRAVAVVYTLAQKAITDNLPATVIEKNSKPILDKISGQEIIPKGQEFIINEVKKLTVDKSTVEMIFK